MIIKKTVLQQHPIKQILSLTLNSDFPDFPGDTVAKNPPVKAGDTGSSPGPQRSHMPWTS